MKTEAFDDALAEKTRVLNLAGKKASEGPPAYTESSPDITAALSDLNLRARTSKPTESQCIAHLKLLEVFNQLREDVSTNDGLFGIRDDFVHSGSPEARHTELLIKLREKRWQIYVTQASLRFEAWWRTCVEPGSRMIQQSEFRSPVYLDSPKHKHTIVFTKDTLPPIGKLSCCKLVN